MIRVSVLSFYTTDRGSTHAWGVVPGMLTYSVRVLLELVLDGCVSCCSRINNNDQLLAIL